MNLASDLRAATRAWRQNPGFFVVAVSSIAISVGAVVTVASLANGLLLKPLPGVTRPGELVKLAPRELSGQEAAGISHPLFRALAAGSRSLSGLVAFTDHSLALEVGGEAEAVLGQAVSGNFFSLLGVEPALGRVLAPEDDAAPGASPFAVLSHDLWQRRFGGDAGILGRAVTLNGHPFTVIGVAPEGFRGLFKGFRFEIWTPLAMAAVVEPDENLEDPKALWLEAAARLAPGSSPAEAAAELSSLAASFAREQGLLADPANTPSGGGRRIELPPLSGLDEPVRRGVLALVAVLSGVATLVLAIACFNVASLLLARAASRRREIAIRLATGAGRGQIVAQLLAESLLLAVIGGAVGLLFAFWATDLFALLQPPPPFTLDLDLAPDLGVAFFALLVSLLSAVGFGLVPALQVSRPSLVPALKGVAASDDGRHRSRGWLVVAQMALSLPLLIVAGLFLRTLERAASLDPGFEPDGVEVARLDLSTLRKSDPAEASRRLLEAAAALPGVASVAVTNSVPLGLGGPGRVPLVVPGHEAPVEGPAFEARLFATSPGLPAVLSLQLLAGRDFSSADGAGAPAVALVNHMLAERFWPGGEAVGRRLLADGRELEIVGVLTDAKISSLNEAPTPLVVVPFAQQADRRLFLFVKRQPGAPPLGMALRQGVRAAEPELPILLLAPLRDVMGIALLPQRVAGGVATALGAIALALAVVGVYGNVAHRVGRRTKEIGLRLALGAPRGTVVSGVVGDGMRLALVATAIGGLLALGAGRLLAGMLYGVTATDPWTFAAAITALLAAAAAASFLPARRAAAVDPLTALRAE